MTEGFSGTVRACDSPRLFVCDLGTMGGVFESPFVHRKKHGVHEAAYPFSEACLVSEVSTRREQQL